MEFRTVVDIPKPDFEIEPCEEMLFVGSCFADNIGARFKEEKFRAVVNPYGVMYNPASILHTIQRLYTSPSSLPTPHSTKTAFLTLATNHIYRLNETGEIVDNCQKRPASDFVRYRLTVDDIVSTWQPILQKHTDKRFIFTVSPIRHIKDGLHENQLSKGILLQAIDRLLSADDTFRDRVQYFPSYEIVLDELRDYRFYAADMLHPSDVAVEYVFSRFVQTYLYEPHTQADMRTLHQLYQDLHHRPMHPESIEYQQFRQGVMQRAEQLRVRFPWLPDALF